jgi:hypothetical protein
VGTQGQNTINITSTLAPPPTDQGVNNKKKGMVEDESNNDILASTANPEKKLKIGTDLNPK